MKTRTLYQLLHVSEKADSSQLKQSYDAKIAELTNAYSTLSDPDKRLKYDNELLLESVEEEKKEVISHPLKKLYFNPLVSSKLPTVLANNTIIMASTNDEDTTDIYKIDVDKAPPSAPLITINSSVVSMASCPDNRFVVGTEDGSIFLISEEGNILFHRKNLTGRGHSNKSIENLMVFNHGKSLFYQTQGSLYLLTDFTNNTIPIKIKNKSNSHIHTKHCLIMNGNNQSYLISTGKDCVEVRDAADFDMITSCRMPYMDYLNSNIYFIEPSATHPDEFYIAYDCWENRDVCYPIIAKGNIQTLRTTGLETIAELKILNKDKPCGDRFGVYMGESLQLLPDGHVIARNSTIMALINIENPQNMKTIPSSIHQSGALMILRDGRVVELVDDITGSYQCFTFKRIHDYFAKLAMLKSEILPSILPKDLHSIVTGYLESHDTRYYKVNPTEPEPINPSTNKSLDHFNYHSELPGRVKAFITYSNKIPDAKWIMSEADDILHKKPMPELKQETNLSREKIAEKRESFFKMKNVSHEHSERPEPKTSASPVP